MRPHRFIDTDAGLREALDQLEGEPRYALDTEFHRERTYWPKAALLQLAWPGHLILVDPLEIDLTPLAELMNSESVGVLHAASQDLEVLELACGASPRHLFDTQIAAGFLGMSTPSLAALHERELGVQLPKGNRLTDWLERPLRPAQLDYAAADVERLLEIHDLLSAQLNERGRMPWAEEEFNILLARDRGPRDPLEAWRKIKEARHLKGTALTIARTIAAWRERRAAEIDQPVRFVLSDIAIVAISQSAPNDAESLGKVRGVDRGMAKGVLGEEILRAVHEGSVDDWRPPRSNRPKENGKDIRPAVALVAAWVNQLARDEALDPALLATRADVEALVRGDEDARLASGWRGEMAGEPITRLVAGDVALAFEDGNVVLEERSRKRIG
ncbi:MAG: HRDC domain-containing protein [Acidimicrobiales bacterium]|nr:HRDC domain-containing protein [Acidimicrobiales bacterium]MDG2218803.1 HRDC domain-containing protein [Acidimicrobiales bacterium]